MDVFGAESKAFQENFTNLPHAAGTYYSESSVDCDSFNPHKESLDSMYASNYPANGEVSPPFKAHNENNSSNGINDYCRFKSEGDVSSAGRRYSHRRATTERRNRINERERDRMHQLCDAFEKLRTVLPYKRSKRGPNRQKLSKIATLLLAQNYIRTLEDMLRRPTEYTNTNATAVAAANMVSQALAAAGVPTVNDHYANYSDGAVSVTTGGSGGMLESAFSIQGVAQEIDSSQFYYMHDYHDYNLGDRVLSAEHAYPYL